MWKWVTLAVLIAVFLGLVGYYLMIGKGSRTVPGSQDVPVPEEIEPQTTPVFEGT